MSGRADAAGEDPPHPSYRRGVGMMLLDRRRRVFVGRRNDMAGDHWQMPQGGLDEGEAPRAAALRELEEEIGTDRVAVLGESRVWLRYDFPPELAGAVWGGRYRGQTQKWFALRFLGTDADINLATTHPEFEAWRWVAADDLPLLIVAFKRQLYRDVIAEFRALIEAREEPAPEGGRRPRP